MAEPPPQPTPNLRPATTAELEARRAREAAALRANLGRRKGQQRARAPAPEDPPCR